MTKKEIEIGKILNGIARWWSPEDQILHVELDDDILGILHAKDLSIYINTPSEVGYSKAAGYCIGIKLRYVVIGNSDEGPILSRRLLGEKSLKALMEYPDTPFYGTVTNVKGPNAFVDIDGVYGICPLRNWAYGFVADLNFIIKPGQKFKFTQEGHENNKFFLSHLSCLPPKSALLDKYDLGTIKEVVVMRRLAPEPETPEYTSWLFVIDGICPGIIKIPTGIRVSSGKTITAFITKRSCEGLKASFIK